MTDHPNLRLHRGDGELPHIYWPAEARLRPEARRQYRQLDPDTWYPVVYVSEPEPHVYYWIDAGFDQSMVVPSQFLEGRGQQPVGTE